MSGRKLSVNGVKPLHNHNIFKKPTGQRRPLQMTQSGNVEGRRQSLRQQIGRDFARVKVEKII